MVISLRIPWGWRDLSGKLPRADIATRAGMVFLAPLDMVSAWGRSLSLFVDGAYLWRDPLVNRFTETGSPG